MGHVVLALLAAALAVTAASCPSGGTGTGTAMDTGDGAEAGVCQCSEGGTRMECRASGLYQLPPLHENLIFLDVSHNNISWLPRDALQPAAGLRDLVLSGNLIIELTDESLPPLLALHTLVLKRNRITYIEDRAFANTPNLRVLRLEENLLSELPAALQLLPALEDLSLANNRVDVVGPGILQSCRRLTRLDLRGNPLTHLHHHALRHLSHLNTLVVSEARGLREVPSLNGSVRLRTLRAERARLTRLPVDLCRHAPQLRSLSVRGEGGLRRCSGGLGASAR